MASKFCRDYAGPEGTSAGETRLLLEGASDDDDLLLRGSGGSAGRYTGGSGGSNQIQRLQGDVNEVVDIMQGNITRVIERGDRLEDLQDKSENLSSSSDAFRIRARSLRQHMWWMECRMRIIIGIVVIVILLLIIVPIIVQQRNKKT